jgi:hypothetical protein
METASQPSGSRRPLWSVIRASLIAVSIVVGLVDGAPIASPRAAERLPPSLRDVSAILRRWQETLLVPWQPMKELFGLSQRWHLFSTTGGTRYRMWIEARRAPDEPWTLLYRAQDEEHTFLADTFAYRRVRNVYNPSRVYGVKDAYPAFASWVAREIFTRRPGFDEMRVSMEPGLIRERALGFEPSGEFQHVLVRHRSEVFP